MKMQLHKGNTLLLSQSLMRKGNNMKRLNRDILIANKLNWNNKNHSAKQMRKSVAMASSLSLNSHSITPISNQIQDNVRFKIKNFKLFYNHILKHENNKAIILQDIKMNYNHNLINSKSLSSSSMISLGEASVNKIQCQLDALNKMKINYNFLLKPFKSIKPHVEYIKQDNKLSNNTNDKGDKRRLIRKLYDTKTRKDNQDLNNNEEFYSSYNTSNSFLRNLSKDINDFSVTTKRASSAIKSKQAKKDLIQNLVLHSFYNNMNIKGTYTDILLNAKNHLSNYTFHKNKINKNYSQFDIKQYYERIKAVCHKIDTYNNKAKSIPLKSYITKFNPMREILLLKKSRNSFFKRPLSSSSSYMIKQVIAKRESSSEESLEGDSDEDLSTEKHDEKDTDEVVIQVTKARTTTKKRSIINKGNANVILMNQRDSQMNTKRLLYFNNKDMSQNKNALLNHLYDNETNDQSLFHNQDYNNANVLIPHDVVSEQLLHMRTKKDTAIKYRASNDENENKNDIQTGDDALNKVQKIIDNADELNKKQAQIMKINQDINFILSDARLFSGQDQSILDEFREKIESLKAFSREEYNNYLADNFAFIQEEIEQIKQARDHELRINMFVKSLNKSRTKVIEMKKYFSNKIKIIDAC